MEVIDNFLSEYQFKQINKVILTDHFPWYWCADTLPPDDDYYNPNDYQFAHRIFDLSDGGILSDYYSLCDILQQRLGVRKLDRIKMNLTPRTFFHRKGGMHTDLWGLTSIQKTAIFYVNTNNGWTEFKKGGKVKSVANRIVIFDSNVEHQGVTCTDEKRRVVINFNYDI